MVDYGIDPELLAQGPGLDQQDLLIQLLRKQAMEGVQSPQGQMVSGHYIAPNILSHIAAAMQPRQKMAQADAMQKEAIQKRVMLQQALQKAQQEWMGEMPQGTPGQAPVPPVQGAPIERGGQMNPEAVGQPGVAPQLPNAMDQMRWMARGASIPGNSGLATALGKVMGEERTREDTQQARREATMQSLMVQRQNKLDQLASEEQRNKERLEDRALDRASREAIAARSMEIRREMGDLVKRTGELTPAQIEVHKRDIQRQIEHMQTQVAPIRSIARIAQPVQNLLDEYTDEKTGKVKPIPGIGFTSKLGSAMGITEHLGQIPKGSSNNNALIQNVINEVLRANAGMSQTITEQANTLKGMLAGGNYDQAQFVEHWQYLTQAIDEAIQERASVASDEAREEYLKRPSTSLRGVTSKFNKSKGPATLGTPQGISQVANDDEYNRLPKGAKYMGPDGITRVK